MNTTDLLLIVLSLIMPLMVAGLGVLSFMIKVIPNRHKPLRDNPIGLVPQRKPHRVNKVNIFYPEINA